MSFLNHYLFIIIYLFIYLFIYSATLKDLYEVVYIYHTSSQTVRFHSKITASWQLISFLFPSIIEALSKIKPSKILSVMFIVTFWPKKLLYA